MCAMREVWWCPRPCSRKYLTACWRGIHADYWVVPFIKSICTCTSIARSECEQRVAWYRACQSLELHSPWIRNPRLVYPVARLLSDEAMTPVRYVVVIVDFGCGFTGIGTHHPPDVLTEASLECDGCGEEQCVERWPVEAFANVGTGRHDEQWRPARPADRACSGRRRELRHPARPCPTAVFPPHGIDIGTGAEKSDEERNLR
jgi:hypothetical protein